MATPSPSMRALARRLLAASRSASDTQLQEAAVVIEKLRAALIRFAGTDGSSSLLRRALALASADVPALASAKVGKNGCLEGIDNISAGTSAEARLVRDEAAVAVAAHLLGLLETFVGEPLTMRLVREAWPDLSPDGAASGSEGDQ